ncbi:MAG TPA: hypothetical protein VNU68_22400 [Verrucomicrobiae bacterium]|nr:hypothetical protein [Verrucomicrobiae bacterium]
MTNHKGHPNYHELGAFTGDATPVQPEELRAAYQRIEELEAVLKFYASEWQKNGDGDSETPGLSRSWMEPTEALFDDEGRKACEALRVSVPSTFPGEGAWSL